MLVGFNKTCDIRALEMSCHDERDFLRSLVKLESHSAKEYLRTKVRRYLHLVQKGNTFSDVGGD